MENVCSKLKDYAERVDPETKIKTFVRFNARNDKDTVELTNVTINQSIAKALEVAVSLCLQYLYFFVHIFKVCHPFHFDNDFAWESQHDTL